MILCAGADVPLPSCGLQGSPRAGITLGYQRAPCSSSKLLGFAGLCHHPLLELAHWGSCWSPSAATGLLELSEPILSMPVPARNLFYNHCPQEYPRSPLLLVSAAEI